MSRSYEPNHNRDWHDFPECAQSCLLSDASGYSWRRCVRSIGQCCPDAKPDGVRHFDVWDCVLQKCRGDNGNGEDRQSTAQEAVDVFGRECAVHGFPLPANFTGAIPSAVDGDHLPLEFVYKDFVTPIGNASISGFYGWGSIIAWAIVLIAATLAWIRPSARPKPDRVSSALSRVFRVSRRWLWYIRRDADLLAALAVPCAAAGDIRIRWQRVTFHQVFTYGHPSFVPESDGEDVAADVLAIRAAIVIVNHFFISSFALAALPWGALYYSTGLRRGWLRQLLRTAAISVAFWWCLVAIKPLFCIESHYVADDWYGGCYMTNLFPRNAVAFLRLAPGVSCGSIGSLFWDLSLLCILFSCLGVLILLVHWDGTRKEGILVFGVLWLVAFIMCYFIVFLILYLYNSALGMVFVSSWYLWPDGRKCTFGPSDRVSFMEMDQIFALAVGGAVGLASIWDSISAIKDMFEDPNAVPESVELAQVGASGS